MMSKISIVVPIYKVEAYLDRCVQSILQQTFTDFDLILVDDGSPDNCPSMCDEYAKKDSRITVIHKENGGLSDARNAGIDWAQANSDSKWITFIDSDDWVHEEYLWQLYNAATTHNVEITVGQSLPVSIVEDVNSAPDQEFVSEKYSAEDLFMAKRKTIHSAWAKLYKKTLFQEARYPKGKLHEDGFITFRLLFDVKWVAFIEKPIYYYYLSPGSITRSGISLKRIKDRFEAVNLQVAYFLKNGYERAFAIAMECIVDEMYDVAFTVKKKGARGCVRKARRALTANLKENRESKNTVLYKTLCKQAKEKLRVVLEKDVAQTRKSVGKLRAWIWACKEKARLAFLKI